MVGADTCRHCDPPGQELRSPDPSHCLTKESTHHFSKAWNLQDCLRPLTLNVFSPPEEGQATAMSSVKSVFSRKAVVRMQLLKEVVGSNSYRINNKYDDNHTPLPVCDIIHRAQLFIGQEVSYDLLGNNCEHFVTLLRYGEGVSEQVYLSLPPLFYLSLFPHLLFIACFLLSLTSSHSRLYLPSFFSISCLLSDSISLSLSHISYALSLSCPLSSTFFCFY